MCQNARILSKFYSIFKRHEKAQQFKDWEKSFQYSINAVFWNEDHGIWFDYDMLMKKHRKGFYPSNVMPIWAECYS